MKKLFFSALVAVVAVGGAYAQTYRNAPTQGSATDFFDCSGTPVISCGDVHTNSIYLNTPNVTTPLIQDGQGPYLLQYLP